MSTELVLQEPFRAVFYAPFYAALARGDLRGVRLITVGDPDRAVANLLSGAADLAWSGPMRVIRDRARDPASALKSFGAVVMGDPFLLVGRGPAPEGFSLGDLARLRLGVVSEVPTPWWTLAHDLRRAGLDPPALLPRARPGPARRLAGPLPARRNLDARAALPARGLRAARIGHARRRRDPLRAGLRGLHGHGPGGGGAVRPRRTGVSGSPT